MKPISEMRGDEADLDREVILSFFAIFRQFEIALRKAGFTKPGAAGEADWDRFAMQIEGRFDPQATPEMYGAFLFVLDRPLRRRRRSFGSRRDMLHLSAAIQELGNGLVRDVNFAFYSEDDYTALQAWLMILEAWSHCDPDLERILHSQGDPNRHLRKKRM